MRYCFKKHEKPRKWSLGSSETRIETHSPTHRAPCYVHNIDQYTMVNVNKDSTECIIYHLTLLLHNSNRIMSIDDMISK